MFNAIKGLGALTSGLGKTGKFAADARKFFLPADMGAGQVAFRLIPDAAFATLAAATAGPEADLIDRLALGGAQFVGGAGGGLAAGGIARKLRATPAIEGLADMAGSFAGDYAGMTAGLGATALKDKLAGGEGLNVYERMSREQQIQMEEAIQQKLASAYGYLPGTHTDSFMAVNGLG